MKKHFENINQSLLLAQCLERVEIRGYKDVSITVYTVGENCSKTIELFNEAYEYNEELPYAANVAIENMVIHVYGSFQSTVTVDFSGKNISIIFND